MTTTNLDRNPSTTAKPNTGAGPLRKIEGVYAPPALHWVGDGFRVMGYFSAIPGAVGKLNPFLLLDYHPPYDYAPTDRPRGVGVHPHRGFETVTLAWHGSVAHHDSAGGGGVIGPGDAQWMTAAGGVLHKEYHEKSYATRGGPFQMAQLWVNLPKSSKMGPPRYQAIEAQRFGLVTLRDDAGSVRVLAGEYEGVVGPALTFTPINVFDIRLNARGKAQFTVPSQHNAGLLVMKGDVAINGTRATLHDFVVFENAGERLQFEASSESQLLMLSGEPIDDPVVQYGPFVMNSKAEILQAFSDFEQGKFGHLEE